jgi:hypothetical protein
MENEKTYPKRKVGAPKGGRVHWLLWNLKAEFKRAYNCSYNYANHNYTFYRMTEKKQLCDIFIIKQTCESCWRCAYVNLQTHEYEFFSCPKSKHLALRMWLIYKKTPPVPEDMRKL